MIRTKSAKRRKRRPPMSARRGSAARCSQASPPAISSFGAASPFSPSPFPSCSGCRAGFQDSLSAYYHCSREGATAPARARPATSRRRAVAAGTFLIFYRGYTRREDWALNLAGIAAAGVAFFPSDFGDLGRGRSRSARSISRAAWSSSSPCLRLPVLLARHAQGAEGRGEARSGSSASIPSSAR